MPPPKPPTIEINLPKFNPRVFQAALVVLLVGWGAMSSVYTVPLESVGVIQRFGKALDATIPPGLHFKAPFGVDRLLVVPVERQEKLEFGQHSDRYGSYYGQNTNDAELQRSMVTGDLNAALVDWVVHYRVEDPRLFLFHVKDPEQTLRDLSEAVMREIIGDRTVDEVITIGRQEIEQHARDRLITLVKTYELGVIIDQVQLQDVDPPVPVQDSFNEVNKAQQERETFIQNATKEYNQIIFLAKGEADQKIRSAEGYKLKRINEAQGDATAFTAQLEEYLKAPEVTRARLYLETMKEVLPQAGPKIIVDDSVKQIMPMIPGMGAAAPAAAAQQLNQGGPRR